MDLEGELCWSRIVQRELLGNVQAFVLGCLVVIGALGAIGYLMHH